ncbi:hypothetical protein AB0D08_26645 [Kitasatospora sp. NPDC048540]|uniref:hypothetical protein n=1 Tax=unclassified Kitasatospora TaxID=2633591 RepID=UPI000A918357|nr:hypothetical protein [Kitasatospora sp. MBT63]
MRTRLNARALATVAAFSAAGALIAVVLQQLGVVHDSTMTWVLWWGTTALGAGVTSRPGK